MKFWLTALLALLQLICVAQESEPAPKADSGKVYVLPIRDDIMPPLVYIVRRGVKEAMQAGAETIIFDIDTNGGRVDTTEEIIGIINQFEGKTVSYVNRKAFSAGAFICFATQKIYMSPQSVIGAAAPILMSPGGAGAEEMSETMEAKITSAISALVRANAEKNGHNVEVADAMVKKTKELVIDGKTLNEKGQILTLTNTEAEQHYGEPPKPLLSAGTVESLDALIEKLGYAKAQVSRITPTGAEKLGTWINTISPLLLIIGFVGLYIEFKTPGFGLPGIVGITAFAVYFLGGYVAGFSGMEWVAVFLLGLILVIVEIFFVPGVVLVGLAGATLMLIAVVMAMVDLYPGRPTLPTLPQLQLPLQNLLIAAFGSMAAIAILARFLPKTPLYHALVSTSASGAKSDVEIEEMQVSRVGELGVTLSTLRPSGKARFGDDVLDVISQGEIIPKGQQVRIVGHSGSDPIVEAAENKTVAG